jgi:hypothetical protein
MAAKPQTPTIINVSRNQITLCGTNSASPLVLALDQTVFRDLEIVDPARFSQLIKDFIHQNKISPAELIIVMAPDVYFSKDLTQIPVKDHPVQIQNFVDAVPLASSSFKIFKSGNSIQLVVINRHFYERIRESFENLGFPITAVIPELVLGDTRINGVFSAESCHVVLKKVDFIKENSFITPSESEEDMHTREKKLIKNHKPFLIIVSFIFIIFSGAMAVILATRPVPKTIVSAKVVPTPVFRVTPAVTAVPSPAASVSASVSDMTIQILNGSNVPGLAGQVQKKLQPLGFTRITTGNTTATPVKTLVVFSPRVDAALRSQVLNLLKEIFPDYSVQEGEQSTFDILITTGQPVKS